jgi:ABC transporter substrate binding protein (PQQ-dependent alcohol dehydrogenase system)
MIANCGLVIAVLVIVALSLTLRTTTAQEGLREIRVAYIDRRGDSAYQANAGYAGLAHAERTSPYAAAALAIKDGTAAARALDFQLSLVHKTLTESEDAITSLKSLGQHDRIIAAVLDLSENDVDDVARALANDSLVLFQARHRDDDLRLSTCRTRLFHTMPSWSMLMDALAQDLMALDWRRVLVLEGPRAADKTIAAAFLASAKKFGLRVSDVRTFVFGNDPRKRDQSNVRLLTGGADYDTVFVADADGEFARNVPYNTLRPRPVVGSAGLLPLAWHPLWERHGAPQLNRRFFRATGRTMSEEDWATWTAVRSILDAIILARDVSVSAQSLFTALLNPELRLELYKGIPGSFRSWSRQLRQGILLATQDAVQNLAPVEGVLHQKNSLDSLGPDEPEFQCDGANSRRD